MQMDAYLFYHVCEGLPVGLRKDTQYLPMLWSFIQTSPFPMDSRFNATGSFPAGASNRVYKQHLTQMIIYVRFIMLNELL